MKERIFCEADIVDVASLQGSGSLVVAEELPDNGYEAVGDTLIGIPIWWRAAPVEEIAEAGLALRAIADVRSITIVENELNPNQDGLALSFAEHLSDHRQRSRKSLTSLLPPLIAANPPSSPVGCARLPHLLACANEAVVRDLVIWEILPTSEAERWLGDTLPDQQLAESYLPQIIELRQRIRSASPDIPDIHPELAHKLASGRYVSALFFYQHFALFKDMFERQH